MMDPNGQQPPGILWSCISRRKESPSSQDVILAEAHLNPLHVDPFVAETAERILTKKSTPGWEFYSLTRMGGAPKLKGIKFHIYQHASDDDQPFGAAETAAVFYIWVVACVYDPSVIEKNQAQSFIEKIIGISEVFRENEEWRKGKQYAGQAVFSPILHQRMQEVSYLGKLAMVQQDLDSLKQVMARNIDMIMYREEQIQKLKDDGERLNEMAAVFKKNSNKLKRKMLLQHAKYGLAVGTAVTVTVAAVTIPIVATL